jgi:transcriptional regulator with XRE-family HTH domain
MTQQEFKDIRERLGLTQRGLGDLLGLDPQTISRLERGEHRIKETTAMALEKVLDDYLAARRGKPSRRSK